MSSNPEPHPTGARERYTATYTFNGHRRQPLGEPIAYLRETVTGMQAEGIDIEFLGATGEIDSTGQLVEVTAGYLAPGEGTIGWLNWRAGVPASGSPQRIDTPDQKALAGP